MSKDLNIIKKFESADLEEFKRPNHNDFLTTQELKASEFSGIRINSITQTREIWVLGEIKASMPEHEIRYFPEKFDELYANVFGLHHVVSVKGGN